MEPPLTASASRSESSITSDKDNNFGLWLASGRAKDERGLTQVLSRVPRDPASMYSTNPGDTFRPRAMAESAHVAGLAVRDSHRMDSTRFSVVVGVTHWITTLSFFGLLVSRVAIFLAHPRLYWGETGVVGASICFCFPAPFYGRWTIRVRPVAAFSVRLGLHPDRVAIRSFRNFQAALPQTFAAGQG